MAAEIITIADAVAAALNAAAGTELPALTATRYYVPTFELSETESLKVSVVPMRRKSASEARGLNLFEYEIEVGILQRTTQERDTAAWRTEVDGMMDTVEQIAEYFDEYPLAGDLAEFMGHSVVPIYSEEHLTEKRLFFSVVTLEFRVVRSPRG